MASSRNSAGTEKLREMHIKDATAAAVYRDAEVLEEVGGMTPEEALTASASIDRSSSRTSLSSRMDTDTLRGSHRQSTSQGPPGTPQWAGGTEAPINGQLVKTAVEEHARVLMDLGVPQDKAVDEGREELREELLPGWWRLRQHPRPARSLGHRGRGDRATSPTSSPANPDYDEAYFVPDRNQDYWTITDEYGAPLRGAPRIHVSELPKRHGRQSQGYAVDAELAAKAARGRGHRRSARARSSSPERTSDWVVS